MDEYPTISAAARHRDWEGCARLMFRELYVMPSDIQRSITADVLSMYLPNWTKKHPHDDWAGKWLGQKGNERPLEPPNANQLDAADAEFENAVIEFENGLFDKNPHSSTSHFATAIRSAVLALQINKWVHDCPEQYSYWRSGQPFDGPTFLEDEAASAVAEIAWIRVEEFFRTQKIVARRPRLTPRAVEIEEAYAEWEKSLL